MIPSISSRQDIDRGVPPSIHPSVRPLPLSLFICRYFLALLLLLLLDYLCIIRRKRFLLPALLIRAMIYSVLFSHSSHGPYFSTLSPYFRKEGEKIVVVFHIRMRSHTDAN